MLTLLALVGFPAFLNTATLLNKGYCEYHQQCALYRAQNGYYLALYEHQIVRKVIWVSPTDPTKQTVFYINPQYLE